MAGIGIERQGAGEAGIGGEMKHLGEGHREAGRGRERYE
jgi:hypothetical protein